MKFTKVLAMLIPLVLLCSCSGKTILEGTRWYTDDINNTVRTVATFEEKTGKLIVNYVLINPGRAKRTGVDGLQYVFDEYYYRDFGENIPRELNDGDDTNAFAIYHTEEDFKSGDNAFITYYHIEEEKFVINGNICLPLEGELARETDDIIAKNKADMGE